MRRIHRSDSNQVAIVEGLRKCGVEVIVIGRPVDLLCRRKCWPDNVWFLIEVKRPDKKGNAVKRSDQQSQTEFCELHKVPKVTSVTDALSYLHGIEL